MADDKREEQLRRALEAAEAEERRAATLYHIARGTREKVEAAYWEVFHARRRGEK
jgi:hypothetical protein